MFLMLTILIFITLIRHKLENAEPYVGIFIVYAGFCAAIVFFEDWRTYKGQKAQKSPD
jgi:hypothetical protein